MVRGFYTAATGMITESMRTDVIANNLANAGTTGYKKDDTVSSEFEAMLVKRINDGEQEPVIGALGRGSKIEEIATIYDQGAVRQTGNTFDLSIQGKGYFVVETPQGVRYTRNGAFARQDDGRIVTQEGYPVLSNGRPIQVQGDGVVAIGANGEISINDGMENIAVGNLDFVEFADDRRLRKEGGNFFAAPPNEATNPATGSIEQGSLEMSNVNVVYEMVRLITAQRAYDSNAKALQSEDAMTDKAVNEVGKA